MNHQSNNAIQIRCLIWSADTDTPKCVSKLLLQSRRVAALDTVTTERELRNSLKLQQHAICVLVLGERTSMLPTCLLRYPDLKVLVITRFGKTGPLVDWLQQGASDVVQSKKLDNLRHSLSRLIDESVLQRQNLALLERIKVLENARDAAKPVVLTTSRQREKNLRTLQQAMDAMTSAKPGTGLQRITLMLISVPEQALDSWSDNTVTRIEAKLTSLLKEPFTVRRVSTHSLLAVSPLGADQTPRSISSTVKRGIAELNAEFIEYALPHIDTITTSVKTAKVETVLQRLEQRSQLRTGQRSEQPLNRKKRDASLRTAAAML